MPRILAILAAFVLALATLAGPAFAFQPPGAGAEDRFECIADDEGAIDAPAPVRGHPGSPGLHDNGAHSRAVDHSDGSSTTAWKPALDEANPVGSSCE